MGSFFGHIDEGMAFALLGIWWIFHVFRDYIKVGCDSRRFEAKLSYEMTIRGKMIPVEIYAKIFISIGGCLIELIQDGGGKFVDDEGHFRKLAAIQHMTIYGLFILHSFLDLAHWFQLPVVRGSNYFVLSVAFAWYGTVFYFHTRGLVKDELETIVHELGIFFNLGAAVFLLWEFLAEEKFWAVFGRCWMVLSVGTWFIHAPFVLYSPSPFPGEDPNPNWNRTDMRNSHFMVGMFGLHLNMNLIFMVTLFYIMYGFYRVGGNGRHGLKSEFRNVQYSLQDVQEDKNNGERSALLVSDEEV